MIFKETFFKNNQPSNQYLFIRQAGHTNRDPNYTITRSQSSTNVIGFISDGILHLKTPDSDQRLLKGTSFVLLKNQSYTIMSDKDDPPLMYWCNVRGSLFDQTAETFFENLPGFAKFDLTDFFLNIEKLLESKTDQKYIIFKEVISAICNIADNKTILCTPGNMHYSLSEQMELYISNHLQSSFSVSEMAREFSFSVDSINRLFKKDFKCTPYQYYQKMRIEIAKTLLLNSQLTIEDIANRLHYTDRNYFSLYFKNTTGVPPALWRKSNKT